MALHYSSEEVKKKLAKKLEQLPDWRGLTRGDAEELARLYQYLGETEISRRYYQQTAKEESLMLLSWKLFNQETAFLENCAYTGLFYYYAGEAEIAARYFDLFIAEALSLTALADEEHLADYHLVHTTCQVFFFLGNDPLAQHYLNQLKPIMAEMHRSNAEAAADNPDIAELDLSIDWRAMELTLEAKRTKDRSLIERAIQELAAAIHREFSYPASTGPISDFDVLHFIVLASEPMQVGEQDNRLFSLETGPEVDSQIRKIYEDTLPKFGLDWVLGERLARLYWSLGNIAVARRFFKRAAAMKLKTMDARMASGKKVDEPGRLESYLHATLLYEYAGEEQSKQELLQSVEKEILEWYAWKRQFSHDNVTKYQSTRLAVQYGLLSENWELVIEASNWLVDVPLKEQPIPAGIVLTIQRVNSILAAGQAGDIERANRERMGLQAFVEGLARPVDTIYHFSERDYLFLLEKRFSGFATEPQDGAK